MSTPSSTQPSPLQLVRRELVHRATDADVLPTGLRRLGPNRFVVDTRWPHRHPYYAVRRGTHHDPMLIGETMRQSTILLAHEEFRVPVGDHFVMQDLSFTTDPDVLRLAGDSVLEPTLRVEAELECADVRLRGGRLAGFTVHITLRCGGRTLATGGGSITCTSARAYRRMRGVDKLTAQPLPPAAPVVPRPAGRTKARDVLLSPCALPGLWMLRVDTRHPTLFNRPNDHVPGMLLLEAAHQAAHLILAPVPFSLAAASIQYERYADLDRPCWVRAHLLPSAADRPMVEVVGLQEGHQVFAATLTADHRAADRMPALVAERAG